MDFDVALRRQTLFKSQEGRAPLKEQGKDTHHGGCGVYRHQKS